jgi:hypothetical protein
MGAVGIVEKSRLRGIFLDPRIEIVCVIPYKFSG